MAGFNTAITGIRAATADLDVTGNNIANASTLGFKASRTEFADIYANAAVGSGAGTTAGSGVLVSDIAQDFSGGNVQFTENNLDLSIDGGGFFQLDDGRGGVTYTRSGAFELDKDGFIKSKSGEFLQGYGLDATGNRLPIKNLQISEKESPPKATSTMSLSFNIDEAKDANALISPYSRTEPSSYTFSHTVPTFDSLGNAHTLRYDMVEQKPVQQVTTYTTPNPFVSATVSGVTVALADFAAPTPPNPDGSLSANAATLVNLQTADPRIADVRYTANPTNTMQVIYKSEATEYGKLFVTGLTSEVASQKASNEVHNFTLGGDNTNPLPAGLAIAVGANAQFEIAGETITLNGGVSGLTQAQAAAAILAKEADILTANPNIKSITYSGTATTNGNLVITYKEASGNVPDNEAQFKYLSGSNVLTGAAPAAGTVYAASSASQGDNSYQGVYRMYSYLNPLGQQPVALDIGKAPDPGAGAAANSTEIGPVIIKFKPSSGVLESVNGNTVPTGVGSTVPKLTVKGADPANPATNVELDLTGTSQFASEQIVRSESQNGYAKGDLTGVSFNSNGEMVASYSNNQNTKLGVVAVASFENQAGLQNVGNTQWAATNDSGNAVLNPPGTGLNGSLRSKALESSNVDLSSELVKLIEAQRNFQASSKTLETMNTVTQNILQI